MVRVLLVWAIGSRFIQVTEDKRGGSEDIPSVNHLYAVEDKGRDYGCSAEGANLAVNLSGKRTLIGRDSGERRRLDGHQRGKPII